MWLLMLECICVYLINIGFRAYKSEIYMFVRNIKLYRILKLEHSVSISICDILLVLFYYLQIEESKRNGDGEEATKLPLKLFSI
jgi:hypothetical protein